MCVLCIGDWSAQAWQSLSNYFHPSQRSWSLLQLQPVMSPPSGSPLGKQTQQLPGLEENEHCFNCWPAHQPDNFTAIPKIHSESSDLVLNTTAFSYGLVRNGNFLLWRSVSEGISFSLEKTTILVVFKKPFYKLFLLYLWLKL